jgi:hypothetical protein
MKLKKTIIKWLPMTMTFAWLALIMWGFKRFGIGWGFVIFISSAFLIVIVRFYKAPALIRQIRLTVEDLTLKGWQPKRKKTMFNWIWIKLYRLFSWIERKGDERDEH